MKFGQKTLQRADLEKLCEINYQMNENEINKRIRSTYLKGKPAPFIKIF